MYILILEYKIYYSRFKTK